MVTIASFRISEGLIQDGPISIIIVFTTNCMHNVFNTIWKINLFEVLYMQYRYKTKPVTVQAHSCIQSMQLMAIIKNSKHQLQNVLGYKTIHKRNKSFNVIVS